MVEVKCKQCGNPFFVSPSRVGKKTFCSQKCRKENYSGRHETIKCVTCGNKFEVYKWELPRKKFCSLECRDKNISDKGTVELACDYCGKAFKRTKSLVNEKNNYCGHDCRAKAKEKKETRLCGVCGKEVTRAVSLLKHSNVFCSKECFSKYRSISIKGRLHPNFNSVEVKCEVCGITFFEPQSRVDIGKGRFCSLKCKRFYFSKNFTGERNHHWSGGSARYRGKNWEQQRKRALFRDDFLCTICGAKDNLHVHHKTPYKEFNGNYMEANKLSNLQTVCCSCHSSIEVRVLSQGNTVASN